MTFELNDYENDDNNNNNNVYFIIKDSYYTPNANIDFIVNSKNLHILEWHLFPFQTKSMHYILQFKFSVLKFQFYDSLPFHCVKNILITHKNTFHKYCDEKKKFWGC